MIQLRLNDTPCPIDLSRCEHLREVIEACVIESGNQVLTSVQVNGCKIPDENLDRLESFPLEGVREVEVATREPRDIACSSLENAAEYSVAVRQSLLEAAGHLRVGRIEDANRITAETSDALTILLYAIETASKLLGEEAEPLRGLDTDIQPWVEEIVTAQKERDWLRVADYLEYEVAMRLEGWKVMCEQVTAESGAASGVSPGVAR